LFLIGLMACFAFGISTVQAQNYFVKDMGMIPEAKACAPAGLNNQGQVAGTATAGEYGYAFRYYYNGKEDEMERIGALGSRGFSISPGGIVVGDAYLEKLGWTSRATLFKGNQAVDLGVLKGQLFSRANSINAMQQVVGYSGPARDVAQSRAFIWTPMTGMMDIGTLGGDYAQAWAINDAGWVTGSSQIPDMGIRERQTHAFIYQPISPIPIHSHPMQDIGTLGGRFSCGMAINANNHVAGYSTTDGTDQITHAFYYDGKAMIDLGVLEEAGLAYQSTALGINNSDQVVGHNYLKTGDTGPFSHVAFVWNRSDGQMVNLNRVIAGWSERYYLISAASINDHGQIAAHAYDYLEGTFKAVLLTPTK
jgi:probable HAF family extracellular repeat protein